MIFERTILYSPYSPCSIYFRMAVARKDILFRMLEPLRAQYLGTGEAGVRAHTPHSGLSSTHAPRFQVVAT